MAKSKRGIASFYIVAFSTLIMTVVAVSFAAVIVSQVTKTSNDDLAQSAYDSAMAGVEDAKLAYYNYQRCLETGMDVNKVIGENSDGAVNCNNIVWWMKNPSCDMVAKILGRKIEDNGDVLIQETSVGDNSMQQAYTCVKLETAMYDYRSSLNSDNTMRLIPVTIEKADEVQTVRVSWYSNRDGSSFAFENFSSGVTFPALSAKVATPPTISVGLIQTNGSFNLDDFEKVSGNEHTNRGTVFLVPTNKEDAAVGENADNYIGVYDRTSGDNIVTATQIVKTNDQTLKNLPYVVHCDDKKEFACSAVLKLPKPYDGDTRNKDTFMLAVSIPYGQPSTDFALEFCTSDEKCNTVADSAGGGAGSGDDTKPMELDGMQVAIDSTGRTNDLYRRVVVRMDSQDTYAPYPLYALELLGGSSGSSSNLSKTMTVTEEWQDWPVVTEGPE